jgi:hypothetical protein
MFDHTCWKMYLYIIKPMKRPAKVARIVAPHFTFLREILNTMKPSKIPTAIPTKVSRILMAFAGFIELITRLKMMKVLIKTNTELIPPEMYLKIFAPKKLVARPMKIIIKASNTGILLKNLRRP